MHHIKQQTAELSAPSLVTLLNRNGQSVQLKVSRRRHEDLQYVFVEPSDESLCKLTGKSANCFAVQLAKSLDVSPKGMNIIELRRGDKATEVWRWRLKLADELIVDAVPEKIPQSVYKNFLLQLAS